MKRLSLLAFLFLSFAAQAKLSKIYCELSDKKQLLRMDVELVHPFKATATLLNEKNEIVPIEVWSDDPGFNYSEYKPWKDMRLSISIEPDGKKFDVWFILDGEEDEIIHEQVSFTLNEAPFQTEKHQESNGKKRTWHCGGE
jgi:hypothetical protein